ncbi:MAG: DUF5693 family protein [Bacillota bacterium]
MGHRKPRSIGWLIALIVLASVSSAWIAWQRNRVEKANSVVELCMDYSEIALYSRRVGINIEDCLRGLAEEGIVSVALEEDTLGSMETAGEIVIIRGSEALALGSNEARTGISCWRLQRWRSFHLRILLSSRAMWTPQLFLRTA